MSLSGHKGILLALSALTALGILIGLAVLLRLSMANPAVGPSLQATVMILLACTSIPFLAAILLANEFIRATREDSSWIGRAQGLSGGEVLALVRHCPAWIKWGCAIVASGSFIHSFLIGEVSAQAGSEMSVRELKGFVSVTIAFLAISLPVIASSAFMKGGYDE